MSILKWYFGTKANYDKLSAEKKSTEDNIFFLLDSSELYYLGNQYTRAMLFYEGALPATPGSQDKIYMNTNTFTGHVYRNGQWKTVFEPASVNALDANENGVVNAITGLAAKNLILSKLQTLTGNAVVSIAYDPTTNKLSYTNSAGQTNDSTVIQSFAASMTRNASTGDINLLSSAGTTLATVNIPLDAHVTGGSYDDTNNRLVLTMQNGSNVHIDATDLFGLYNELDTATIDTTTVDQNGVLFLKMDVKKSAQAGNALEIKQGTQEHPEYAGLYLSLEHLISFVAASAVDEILVADAQGNAVASGKKIGGATLSQAHPSTLVASEAAVAAEMADAKQTMESTYLKTTAIRGSYAEFARAYGFQEV